MPQENTNTVYFDHNALIDVIENRTECLFSFDNQNIRVVASLWNLYEIVGSSNLEQALNLAKYLDRGNVYWLQEKNFIQSQELQAFIYNNYYSFSFSIQNPIRKNISEALATLNDPTSIIVNCTPSKLVRAWHQNKNCLSEIEIAKQQTVNALNIIQEVRKNDKLTPDIEKEITLHYLKCLSPRRNPKGKQILEDELQDILEYCISDAKSLYKKCPAIHVENKLKLIRTLDSKRKPEVQDAPDLQHAILAIAYCDYFVTKDGFLRDCAKYVVKRCNLKTKIIGSVSEL